MVPAIAEMTSKVSLSGHTDQAPYISGDEEYSNWELSVDRANAARRALVSAGFPEDKIGRVVGLGSSVPFVKDDPLNPINRRISMIVLNKKAEEALTQEAGPALEARATIEGRSPPLTLVSMLNGRHDTRRGFLHAR